ncbi:MAG: histidinol-phosphate aminotransferase family protein [Spirosomaceae bacterium]|nr:histidinol-phosphate aminotransferase family protein [Spirosomataceae bacterium]
MNTIAPLFIPQQPALEQQLWAERHASQPTRLHCNESPFDLPLALKQQITAKMADLAWNRYPDFYNTQLTALVAQHAQVQPENVLLGNGSSQLIQQVVGGCAKFLSKVVIESPTFTFYHQVCQNERMTQQEWALDLDGSYDLSTFPKVNEPALVILTTPNNPMGTTLPQAHLETLLTENSHCIFLVDEAYAEFGDETVVSLTTQYPNLLVLKTLSKGYGLPCARFGYLVGNSELVKVLKNYSVPFTINVFTEVVVTELLTNAAVANALHINRERIKNLRDFVFEQLDEMSGHGFTAKPSSSNFILLRFQDEVLFEQVKAALLAFNILVSYPVASCLRLTIGSEVEMSRVLRLVRGCAATS